MIKDSMKRVFAIVLMIATIQHFIVPGVNASLATSENPPYLEDRVARSITIEMKNSESKMYFRYKPGGYQFYFSLTETSRSYMPSSQQSAVACAQVSLRPKYLPTASRYMDKWQVQYMSSNSELYGALNCDVYLEISIPDRSSSSLSSIPDGATCVLEVEALSNEPYQIGLQENLCLKEQQYEEGPGSQSESLCVETVTSSAPSMLRIYTGSLFNYVAIALNVFICILFTGFS